MPKEIGEVNVLISFLGYKNKIIPLSQFKAGNNKVFMDISVEQLSEVNLSVPKDASALVRETLKRKGENYFKDPTVMTAFYRETIKKEERTSPL
ncbi:hypothetical protein [Maribacter halichondriae]|uniref:hypothetical protein n=1 Tax=Maribacter halichondriae TaxID=2980554 RepID=UPI002359F8BB|nr:hypothetical protein [Maribacter sp. Hal144]